MNVFTWNDENLVLTDLSVASTLKKREKLVSNFNSVNKSREGPGFALELFYFICM